MFCRHMLEAAVQFVWNCPLMYKCMHTRVLLRFSCFGVGRCVLCRLLTRCNSAASWSCDSHMLHVIKRIFRACCVLFAQRCLETGHKFRSEGASCSFLTFRSFRCPATFPCSSIPLVVKNDYLTILSSEDWIGGRAVSFGWFLIQNLSHEAVWRRPQICFHCICCF